MTGKHVRAGVLSVCCGLSNVSHIMLQPRVWAPDPDCLNSAFGFSTVTFFLCRPFSCSHGVMSSFTFPLPSFHLSLPSPFSFFYSFPLPSPPPHSFLLFFLNVFFFFEVQASLKLCRFTRLAWNLAGCSQTLYQVPQLPNCITDMHPFLPFNLCLACLFSSLCPHL